jgi:hypothetical protein
MLTAPSLASMRRSGLPEIVKVFDHSPARSAVLKRHIGIRAFHINHLVRDTILRGWKFQITDSLTVAGAVGLDCFQLFF